MKMKRRIFLVCLGIAAGLVSMSAMALPQPQSEPAARIQQGGAEPGTAAVPALLTLPSGTIVTVRTTQMLSSDRNQAGDSFTTVLEQPLVAQGWVAARRGQLVMGRIAATQKAGRSSGVSQLAIELSELTLVDGQQAPIRTQLIQSSAGTSRVQDAAAIGTTTGIGAAIGGVAGGGEGAAVGAAAGAAAGIAGVLTTRGRPTEIPPESVMTFRLENAVTIDTQHSQQAFLPVTSQDYASSAAPRAAERYTPRVYQAPPGRYYGPYDYYGGYYPNPYIGYYGAFGFGYGPRIYMAPRIFIGPHFGRRR
jgi:hypothetical protein